MNTTSSKGRLPFDPDSLMFAVPLAVIAAIGWIWGAAWIWFPALVLAICVLGFFRDPPRRGQDLPGAVWSPADGKIVAITENTDPGRGDVPGTRIVIFLSVLNVHINRAPCAGLVERVQYERGKFLNALDDASSDRNESNWIFLQSGRHAVTVRQIAGLIARRIVCRVREGQNVIRGQRIGLIRFGSRTELYLPADAELKVEVGQKVRGAQTLMAILPD